MRFGYNTNGFAHHPLEQTLIILSRLGYESVALTLDYHTLNPFASDAVAQARKLHARLKDLQLHCVVETGARFLLDPWHKHQPTLLSGDTGEQDRRMEFLLRAVDIAAELGADAVSFWSGTPQGEESREILMQRLVDGCRRLCDHATTRGVKLAFEPEPGMFIDTMPRFAELLDQVAHPAFGLTLDLGHLHCQGEIPIADQVRRWRSLLWNVHIEDMRRGVHDHLMFGEGEIDFKPVLEALREVGYAGGVHVELSRHSHDAVNTARRALAFLRSLHRPERPFPASRAAESP
jgi:sugar phosphate isomerase/epimerase